MKKILNYFIFLIALTFATNVSAKVVTIDDVVNKFNSTTWYSEYGRVETMKATYTDTGFFVTETINNQKYNTVFNRIDNILSIDIDHSVNNIAYKIEQVNRVIDIIGQLHGYKDKELSAIINTDIVKKFKIAQEGLEVIQKSENVQTIKIDLSKKIPLGDYSQVYFTKEDFTNYLNLIPNEGTFELSKGNLYLNKTYSNNKVYVTIGERFGSSKLSYNSILVMIDLIFEENQTVNRYVKKYYPEVTAEDKSFSGVNIDVKATKTKEELIKMPNEYDYEAIKIEIDKSILLAAANTWSKETDEDKGSTPGVDYEITDYEHKEEKKSNKNLYIIIAVSVIAILGIIGIVVFIILKKKKDNDKEEIQLDSY